MKTIGKTLEFNNTIVELTNKEIVLIVKGLDFYSRKLVNQERSEEVSKLMFLFLGIEKY